MSAMDEPFALQALEDVRKVGAESLALFELRFAHLAELATKAAAETKIARENWDLAIEAMIERAQVMFREKGENDGF
jgi:hypothetical protein